MASSLALAGSEAAGAALRRDLQPVAASTSAAAPATSRHAQFGNVHPSTDLQALGDWVARSRDNGDAPFLIVDKRNARVLVFDGDSRLLANSPVLLGFARGDDSVPGIGERKIADIKPFERTTPAGRFVAEEGRNLQDEQIIWVDYAAAVSMHRVRATNPRERRLERLATPTAADNRISYGCINVPVRFFDAYISPIFNGGKRAVVYVLPEVHALPEVFPALRADGSSRPAQALAASAPEHQSVAR